jgi:hypothetical protein
MSSRWQARYSSSPPPCGSSHSRWPSIIYVWVRRDEPATIDGRTADLEKPYEATRAEACCRRQTRLGPLGLPILTTPLTKRHDLRYMLVGRRCKLRARPQREPYLPLVDQSRQPQPLQHPSQDASGPCRRHRSPGVRQVGRAGRQEPNRPGGWLSQGHAVFDPRSGPGVHEALHGYPGIDGRENVETSP